VSESLLARRSQDQDAVRKAWQLELYAALLRGMHSRFQCHYLSWSWIIPGSCKLRVSQILPFRHSGARKNKCSRFKTWQYVNSCSCLKEAFAKECISFVDNRLAPLHSLDWSSQGTSRVIVDYQSRCPTPSAMVKLIHSFNPRKLQTWIEVGRQMGSDVYRPTSLQSPPRRWE
jgi:hypothetical protein